MMLAQTVDIHTEKNESQPLHHPYTKISAKLTINHKGKTTNVLKESKSGGNSRKKHSRLTP